MTSLLIFRRAYKREWEKLKYLSGKVGLLKKLLELRKIVRLKLEARFLSLSVFFLNQDILIRNLTSFGLSA